ncbi:MAG: PhoH family protein [Acidimicrobiia bacterium]|nr:PhoH family protein [Acidimicrobiia bacterium]
MAALAGEQPRSALVRNRWPARPLVRTPEAWGLRPRSKEQQFALDLLLDPDVRVVALDGMAGTGKTILALAAGLDQVVEQSAYDKLAVYRRCRLRWAAPVRLLPGQVSSTRSSTHQ